MAGLLAAAWSWGALACDLEAASVAVGERCNPAWLDSDLRMNDVQVIGTHNSYKLALSFSGQGYRRCNPSRPVCRRSPNEAMP